MAAEYEGDYCRACWAVWPDECEPGCAAALEGEAIEATCGACGVAYRVEVGARFRPCCGAATKIVEDDMEVG